MSANEEISNRFEEMAALLELSGANAFKVNAYRRAARACADHPADLGRLAAESPAAIGAIEGVGASTSKKICEFVESGKMSELELLRESIPLGLPALLSLQGLGPKTVRILWQEAQVTDLASLKAALEDGRLANLAGMGSKKLQNLRDAISFAEEAGKRWRIDEALNSAELVMSHLRRSSTELRIEYAGSLRRGRETIGDVDLLACTNSPTAIADSFCTMPGVERVLARGDNRCSVRLNNGLQIDLRTLPDSCFGAALLYFTGSKEHNIKLRERALAMGMRLNEYGLFKDDGERAPQDRGEIPVAALTEVDIYRALGLPFIQPELRESQGELALDSTPGLLEDSDIRSELHSHTQESDGHLTLLELVQAAKARGFHTIAVTDHSRSSVQANGLNPERLLRHIDAIHETEAKVGGIRVLAGSEVDIHADGSLDYEDELLSKLDWVVASPHASLRQDPALATKRLLAAVRHPLVHVLGHPTGRIINGRAGLDPDMEAICGAAAEHQTALEINSHPQRLDLRDRHIRIALAAGANIAINCDVHRASDFDLLRYGVITGRRALLTPQRCINCWSVEKLEAFRRAKRL
ncbi:MAG: DNA polymerase/3'-5' exonuclease PolX [Phycisphaerales bacterium]|nr:DNA polymerase/3'-5' exonuclease PolX [Phycisphaerales bacterium]